MSEREEIGQRIVTLRQQKNITQAELAEMTGIKQNNISRFEAGKFDPKLSTLNKIGAPLGVVIDFVEKTL